MHLLEMPQLALDDVIRYALHRLGDVGEKPGLLTVVEQIKGCSREDALGYQLAVSFRTRQFIRRCHVA